MVYRPIKINLFFKLNENLALIIVPVLIFGEKFNLSTNAYSKNILGFQKYSHHLPVQTSVWVSTLKPCRQLFTSVLRVSSFKYFVKYYGNKLLQVPFLLKLRSLGLQLYQKSFLLGTFSQSRQLFIIIASLEAAIAICCEWKHWTKISEVLVEEFFIRSFLQELLFLMNLQAKINFLEFLRNFMEKFFRFMSNNFK